MPALVAVAIEEIGASLYAYQIGATLIQYSTVIAYATVAAGTYAASRSMMKMPNMGGLQSEVNGRMSMIRDTVASRRVVYGTVRVSGPIIFASTTSNTNSTKNENLHMVIALAGHKCGGLKGVYLNDVRAVDETGAIQSTFSGSYEYSFKFGEGLVGATTQSAFIMDDPAWTSQHRLDGICALYSRMVANPNVFPNGIPNITAVVQGYDVPDMSNNNIPGCTNPALILRHYLLNYFKCDSNEIDDDSFSHAVDVCNETPLGDGVKRYECNYSFTLNTKPQKVIEDILKTMYGKLAYVNGKFVLKAGAYTEPVMSINEDDIIGTINVTTRSSQANAINSVKGTFVDGETYTSSFQPADFVPVSSSVYLAEDAGLENPYEIELAGVTNNTQARRIAKITLRDSRQDLTANMTCKIGALRLIAGDTVYVSVKRYGWDTMNSNQGKIFQVMEMTINNDLSIGLVLKETAPEVYEFLSADDVDRDFSPNTNLPNPFIVPSPSGFAATESTTKDKDGTVFPSVTLNWSASLSGSIDENEIDYRDTASVDYTSLGTFSRIISEASTLDVIAGHSYEFRIRSLNYLGTYSPYASSSLKVNGNTTAPQPPSSIQLIGGTGSLYVTWVNDPVDTDYKATKVYVKTTNDSASADYQGSVSGTSWNKVIINSGSYYVWLKNVNTSDLESTVAAGGSVNIASITTDVTGPSGSKGDTNYTIYRRFPFVPSTPPNSPPLPPTNWSLSVPDDNGDALWVSTGLISGADGVTSLTPWTTPKRLSGKTSFYQGTAPDTASVSVGYGDLWFDTSNKMKVYRWSGSWMSVQDENIAPLSSSIVSITSSITTINSNIDTINGNVTNVANGLIYATGSISNLYTQSYNLSSSYYASSASFSSSISNIQLTYATKDFAISVSAFSSSAAYNSATASANSYTNNQLINYATKDLAVSIAAYSSSVAVNTATGSSNAYTDNKLLIYATTSSAQTYAQTAGTASYNAATASFLNTLSSYATQTYAQTVANTAGTASYNAATASFNNTLASYATQTYAQTQAQLAGTASYGAATASFLNTLTSYATQTYAQSIASSTVSAAITSSVNSGIISASVAVTSKAVADLSGSVAGEYVVAVTGGNRVAGFKILSSTVSSSFDVQADRFRIYNNNNGTVTQSFLADSSGVYIDNATIRNLDAGKLQAGTVAVAIGLTSANIYAPRITGSAFMIDSRIGIRADDDSSIITITGGVDNGDGHGAQIDYCGNSYTGAEGILNLVAGNVGSGTNNKGLIQFYTGGNQRGFVFNSGVFNIKKAVSFGSAGDSITNCAISADYGSSTSMLVYAGGSGATTCLASNVAHRWMKNQNNTCADELMALDTSGNLYAGGNMYADAFISPSSLKLKNNIRRMENGLLTIQKIEPVHFTWKFQNDAPDTGFIAEQIQDIIPNVVYSEGGEVKGIYYAKIVPYLVAAIQEQQKQIDELKKLIKK